MINKHIIKEFGQRVRELRVAKNLSQEQLSTATGFHRTYIGMIERGERNISLTNMVVFSKAFEIKLSKLMDFSSVNPKHTYINYELKVKK